MQQSQPQQPASNHHDDPGGSRPPWPATTIQRSAGSRKPLWEPVTRPPRGLISMPVQSSSPSIAARLRSGVAPRSKPAAGRLTRPIQVGVCPPARAPPRPTPADAWLRARVPAAGIPAGIARMPTYVAKLGNWEAAVAAAEGGASAGAAGAPGSLPHSPFSAKARQPGPAAPAPPRSGSARTDSTAPSVRGCLLSPPPVSEWSRGGGGGDGCGSVGGSCGARGRRAEEAVGRAVHRQDRPSDGALQRVPPL